MMIGTLTLSSKIILPPSIFCSGSQFSSRRTFHLKFLPLDSVVQTRIRLRSSSIQLSQVTTEEAEEIEALSLIKTVRVRFQLQKECVFGEHFFIIGDDPLFGGLWDLDHPLPLTWSHGHLWTVDLDLPVGIFLEFKFILKSITGEILWQPGPNRALQTWPTNNTIRICEDWENPDLQMIVEEDFVPLNQQETNLDMPLVAHNITHPKLTVEEEDELPGTVQQHSSEVTVENAGYVSAESVENSSSHFQTEKTMDSSNVKKECISIEVEGPVLVPGLIPLCDSENEEVIGPITYVSMEVTNEGKAETFPEVHKKQETKGERKEKGKVKAVSLFEKSEQETVRGVAKRDYNAAEEVMQQQQHKREEKEPVHVLLENDIQWGRRALYKLLSNFGLF